MGKGPTGVIKSILDTSRTDGKVREEIFVDIVEKISCTFSSSGSVQNSQIDGAIQVHKLPFRPIANMLQPPTADQVKCMKTRLQRWLPLSAWPCAWSIASVKPVFVRTALSEVHLRTAGEELPDRQSCHCHCSE